MNELFYRYEFDKISMVPNIKLLKFETLKETPKGYWIIPFKYFRYPMNDEYRMRHKKWISKTSRKRYAYPTKEEALFNYQKRTEFYIKYLKRFLNNATTGLKIAETYDVNNDK